MDPMQHVDLENVNQLLHRMHSVHSPGSSDSERGWPSTSFSPPLSTATPLSNPSHPNDQGALVPSEGARVLLCQLRLVQRLELGLLVKGRWQKSEKRSPRQETPNSVREVCKQKV